MNPTGKYVPFPVIKLDDRQWPSRQVTKAPVWCSVDLRDGNQAIPVPMTVAKKIEMFKLLVQIGFKEIEVGFPAASPTEFEFVRRLIDEGLIPDDVTIQVLVQAREDLIKRTVESLMGAKRVIIHMYNSTSPSQRKIVFGMEKPQIVELAIQGTKWVKKHAEKLRAQGTEVLFQYSPESFSATEVDFALEVCEAVMDVWKPTPQNKMILNLPDTVEVAMCNVYADQVEWFCRHLAFRDSVIISLHAHNDRGTGVAATEFGILAGADRVEGTLFGNGERTGNTCLVTVALNMYGQGINPELDFSDIDHVREVYEGCTEMEVSPRHPYAGKLVFTAFSGSHQDAIRKGLRSRAFAFNAATSCAVLWDVPYLPIDPEDLGRRYEEVIRVNGQSGKGGIAYLLETECGMRLPKDMLREFGAIAGRKIDALGREVTAPDLKQMFWAEYIERETPYRLLKFQTSNEGGECHCWSKIMLNAEQLDLPGKGNGTIHAFVCSLQKERINVSVLDYSEHTLGKDETAQAICYVQLRIPDGSIRWGAGVDTNSELAPIRAIISALNRE
ncbi:MAG: 2-isopropylmalate synthase [Candidatus Staskawiczbacteria bacterium]|nr:2-isopropylmalate synthase [Candidatus Staskawiczbacteria bacterium]